MYWLNIYEEGLVLSKIHVQGYMYMNLAYIIGRNITGVQGYNICPMILYLIKYLSN